MELFEALVRPCPPAAVANSANIMQEETILRDTADHCEQCSAMKTLHSASDIALGFRIII